VKQLWPDCRTVGRFSVRAHAGLNRVHFTGRVGGRQLSPGTYRITARTADGRTLQRVTIVVIEGAAPTKTELAALRGSNACSNSLRLALTAVSSTGASNTGAASAAGGGDRGVPEAQPSARGPGGVLGAGTVEKTARAIRPALIALLVAAILLLGLASLPQVAVADARLNEALARHRTEIAGAGAAALVAVLITFLLG
jgi:hypothetical protein